MNENHLIWEAYDEDFEERQRIGHNAGLPPFGNEDVSGHVDRDSLERDITNARSDIDLVINELFGGEGYGVEDVEDEQLDVLKNKLDRIHNFIIDVHDNVDDERTKPWAS